MEEFIDEDKIAKQVEQEKADSEKKDNKPKEEDFSNLPINLKEMDKEFTLDFMAYCLASKQPLNGINFTHELYYDILKWRLSCKYNIPFFSPIWENYTEEQLYLEWKANVFSNSEDAVTNFELKLKLGHAEVEEMTDWFDRMIEENQHELEETIINQEDEITFSPSDIV